MTKKTFTVEVIREIEVELDDDIFTDQFMEAFRASFYAFDSVDEHVEHLAQMEARELIGFDNFVEGYGDIKEMGITMKVTNQTEDVIDIDIPEEDDVLDMVI